MKAVAVIPARYASTRFPGKPLALLSGKPVIEHTYRQVLQAVDRVAVATDDERIAAAVRGFGGEAVLTSSRHDTGTSRVCEAVELWAPDADIVLNVQGDEPLVSPSLLSRLIESLRQRETADIATAVREFDPADGYEALADENLVKVVVDDRRRALYFSRSVIPCMRGVDREKWPFLTKYLVHVGVYAFRRQTLGHLCGLPPSPMEEAERLEQLRWLGDGISILTIKTSERCIGIDTPDDLAAAEVILKSRLNH